MSPFEALLVGITLASRVIGKYCDWYLVKYVNLLRKKQSTGSLN